MSESRPSAETDVERELDQIAAELYALLPDRFAEARDDEIRKARSAGRQTLARELGRLRRPTQSAWLINQLWRDQSDTIEELLGLADDLAHAQAQGSISELHRLTARRGELESALLRGARALAERAGVDVTATMERDVQGTLAAALALPEVASEMRTGRLVKPAFYAGFGLPESVPSTGAPQRQAREAVKSAASARQRKSDVVEPRAAQRESRRRKDAEQRVQEARVALEAAAATLADRTRAADVADQHHKEVHKRLEEIREQLRALEKEAAAAEDAARVEARRRREAEKGHGAARLTLERAERVLNQF